MESTSTSSAPWAYRSQEDGGDPIAVVHNSDERGCRYHSINVPVDATIRIYTLDGDVVRTLEHPDPNLSRCSSETSWEVVSRNTQAVTSGIYVHWEDSKLGSHVGKIVIIK